MYIGRILYCYKSLLVTILLFMAGCLSDALQAQNSITVGSTATATSYDVSQLLEDESTSSRVFSIADQVPLLMQEWGIADEKTFCQNVYIRWYIVTNDGQETIQTFPNTNSWRFEALNNETRYTTYLQGFVYYYPHANTGWIDWGTSATFANIYGMRLHKNNSSLSWKDYKVVCVLTNNLSGVQAGSNNGSLTKEPTTLKAVVNFATKNFSDLTFRHNFRPGGTIYDTDMIETVNGNNMQKTRQWKYNISVEPGNTVKLVLPFEYLVKSDGSIQNSDGSDCEPHAYYRWFDYNTNSLSANTSRHNSSTTLNKLSYGYTAINSTQLQVKSDVGVINYKAPSTGFTGAVIACDVSDYHDYEISATHFTEPTLSIRYLFNIRPAAEQAQELLDKTDVGNRQFYENNGHVTFNCNGDDTEFSLRTDIRFPGDYYYYALKQSDINDTDKSKASTTLRQGQSILWFVVHNGSLIYAYSNNDVTAARLFPFKKSDLPGVGYDDEFEVYAYLSNKTESYIINTSVDYEIRALWDKHTRIAPVAYHICTFLPDLPVLSQLQLQDPQYRKRTIDYLDYTYTLAAEINFDNLDASRTKYDYSYPTTANNMRQYPDNIDNTFYGFIYPSLADYKTQNPVPGNVVYTFAEKYSPVHGEFGLYKSARLDGVSNTEQGYRWYWHPTEPFFDRAYEYSGGNKYGYFMYTDASDESRPLVSVDVNTQLCAGTNIVFTAWIADITAAIEKPQVMFKIYGVDGTTGEETLLHSTMSETVKVLDTSGNVLLGQWRQVYSEIVLQHSVMNVDYSHYRVSIDNFCKSTRGADYAIDDIRIYMKTATVELIQQSQYCGTGPVTLKARSDFDQMCRLYGMTAPNETKTLRYRLMNNKGNTVAVDYNGDGVATDYATITLDASFPAADAHYQTIDGKRYFFFFESFDVTLDMGSIYYLSVASYSDALQQWVWGSPSDICSVVSNDFNITLDSFIIKDINNDVASEYSIECTQGSSLLKDFVATLAIPDGEGGRYMITTINFDWYTKGVMPVELITALKNLRADYPAAGSGAAVDLDLLTPGTNLTAQDIQCLQAYKDDLLLNTRTIGMTLQRGNNVFTGRPVVHEIMINGYPYIFCDDNLLKFEVYLHSVGMPVLDLGFADVDYQAVGGGSEALRLGLKQIQDMQTNGSSMLLPVKDYSNGYERRVTKGSGLATINGDEYLNLIATNDPTFAIHQAAMDAGTYAIGQIQTLRAALTDTDYDVSFVLKGNGLQAFVPHEGYWYKVQFGYRNDEASSQCNGYTQFVLKVVPEYLTFTGTGSNWNNDDNWARSTAAILYKTDYTDYSSSGGSGLSHQGYAPMRFTKVTLPTAAAPCLYALPLDAATRLPDMTSPYKSVEAATSSIEYDLMLKTAATGYDCEKFYGNTCREIYFKPAATLSCQHLLSYTRAWVDVELAANSWYTMSSPLQSVVAGDMYLPLASRRQETEAFCDIFFDNSLVTNDRSLLPVYQRSWDKSGSIVLRTDGSTYDAYSGKVSTWTHVYNDVLVDYSSQGFSIKADRRTGTGKVLFRLPKADTHYRYFAVEDEEGQIDSPANTVELSRDQPYRLRTDASADGNVTIRLADNSDADNDIYLLGNPYMATINMQQFFAINTQLEAKYWTIEADEQYSYSEATGLGSIAPLRSFMVQLKAGGSKQISFQPTMTLPMGTTTTSTRMEQGLLQSLTLALRADRYQSEAYLHIDDSADMAFCPSEDTEALFDSNLDSRIALYTIAGTQAVGINSVPGLSTIPMGIWGGEEGETVYFSLRGQGDLSIPVYLWDAETNQCTQLEDGEEIALQVSAAGRYYLLDNPPMSTDDGEQLQMQVHGLDVILSASEPLESIVVYDMDGRMLMQQAPHQPCYTLALPQSGVYVIRVQTKTNNKVKKILVNR